MSAAQLIRFALALVLCALLCLQLVAAGEVERDLSHDKEPPKPHPQPAPEPDFASGLVHPWAAAGATLAAAVALLR